jgi:hypothetical protein
MKAPDRRHWEDEGKGGLTRCVVRERLLATDIDYVSPVRLPSSLTRISTEIIRLWVAWPLL